MFLSFLARFASFGARRAVAGVVAAIAAPAALAQNPASAPEAGLWIDHTGKGAVEIAPCGAKLCGHIFWLKEPVNPKGQPLVDIHNPDASKRKRPICGLPVLGALQRQAGGAWDAGWVYDPKEGKSYDLEIKAEGRDHLAVTGYMGTKFFGKTMTWTRAKMDLPRCGAAPPAVVVAKGAAPSAPPAQTKPGTGAAALGASAVAAKPPSAPPQGKAPSPALLKQAAAGGGAPRSQGAAKTAVSAVRGAGAGPIAPAAKSAAPKIAAPKTAAPIIGATADARDAAPRKPMFSVEPTLLSGPVPAKRPAANGKPPATAGADAGAARTAPAGRFGIGAGLSPPPR